MPEKRAVVRTEARLDAGDDRKPDLPSLRHLKDHEVKQLAEVRGLSVDAVRVACFEFKRVTPHTLRHAFCTHMLQNGNDVATVQQLMGHEKLETTQIYSHADKALGRSPLDGVVKHLMAVPVSLDF